MPNITSLTELWPTQRIPDVPEVIIPPSDFSEQQADDLTLFVQILQVLEKPNGARRSIYGLNRAAQYRWPTLGITITLVCNLVDSWAITGAAALVDMVRQGKIDSGQDLGNFYDRIRHQLRSMAVALVESVGADEEVFQLRGFTGVERWSFYRVAAETNYGAYRFTLVAQSVPEWYVVEQFCLWHTRIESPC